MKKGFTLIELLAVIAILAIILLIAVPNVISVITNAKNNIYIKSEQMLSNSAINYFAMNITYLPDQIGDISIVKSSALKASSYITDIKDPKNPNMSCEGYVIATKNGGGKLIYQPFLRCGSNYQTTGYVLEYETAVTISSVEALVVAGGGAGGYRHASGGGAGGLIFNATQAVSMINSVSVGNGAIGQLNGSAHATNGENSIFGSLTALGGGGAGAFDGGFNTGNNGGSGGGSVNLTTALGTAGQGNSGGIGASNMTTPYNHSGGGGAGGVGLNGNADSHGSGGPGLYYGDRYGDSFGENGYFAGGGGGGGHDPAALNRGLGGIGGGGDGGTPGVMTPGDDALPNTGGGGGGASTPSSGTGRGGNGGSGIVLIRYAGERKANGGTVSSYNGYTIHAFTSGTSSLKLIQF